MGLQDKTMKCTKEELYMIDMDQDFNSWKMLEKCVTDSELQIMFNFRGCLERDQTKDGANHRMNQAENHGWKCRFHKMP